MIELIHGDALAALKTYVNHLQRMFACMEIAEARINAAYEALEEALA